MRGREGGRERGREKVSVLSQQGGRIRRGIRRDGEPNGTRQRVCRRRVLAVPDQVGRAESVGRESQGLRSLGLHIILLDASLDALLDVLARMCLLGCRVIIGIASDTATRTPPCVDSMGSRDEDSCRVTVCLSSCWCA
eukprot:3289061-Rhodomonas_salina.1